MMNGIKRTLIAAQAVALAAFAVSAFADHHNEGEMGGLRPGTLALKYQLKI